MKRSALFVGVNEYDDPSITDLSCAERDCVELYTFFKGTAGYDHVEYITRQSSEHSQNYFCHRRKYKLRSAKGFIWMPFLNHTPIRAH